MNQVQLASYFAGYSDILSLREEIKQKTGKKFDLKAFHKEFLSFGNAPVPIIRKLMLAKLQEEDQGQRQNRVRNKVQVIYKLSVAKIVKGILRFPIESA
ncbi:DUF885 family protein [Microbulbifer sp. A4B17]|uniref:DUF885 family protein n=1 Tax=Microbulbifer sp. A4B17 TaxID=359370 RepID=UPI001EDE30C4|nr:DUF885 family protein [Microbulbifer sp. A4B17]